MAQCYCFHTHHSLYTTISSYFSSTSPTFLINPFSIAKVFWSFCFHHFHHFYNTICALTLPKSRLRQGPAVGRRLDSLTPVVCEITPDPWLLSLEIQPTRNPVAPRSHLLSLQSLFYTLVFWPLGSPSAHLVVTKSTKANMLVHEPQVHCAANEAPVSSGCTTCRDLHNHEPNSTSYHSSSSPDRETLKELSSSQVQNQSLARRSPQQPQNQKLFLRSGPIRTPLPFRRTQHSSTDTEFENFEPLEVVEEEESMLSSTSLFTNSSHSAHRLLSEGLFLSQFLIPDFQVNLCLELICFMCQY